MTLSRQQSRWMKAQAIKELRRKKRAFQKQIEHEIQSLRNNDLDENGEEMIYDEVVEKQRNHGRKQQR